MNYKDQINSLMRDFAVFLKQPDRKTDSEKVKVFLERKEDILLFLYIIAVNLANEDYVANINTLPEFQNISFLENTNNYAPGINNKMILKNIRNAFDHASGEVETDGEDIIISNHQRIKNHSIVNYSIRQTKKNLVELLRKSIANQKQSPNPMIRTLLGDIEKIENDDFANISDELSFTILMNLLLCYNKESLIDKYIESQTSFLDLSKFSVTTREEWDKREIDEGFLEAYTPIFKSDDDRKSFNREWRNGKKSKSNSGRPFIYDVSKYPVDTKNRKHIPTPVVLDHLRNANAHGWIEFKDGKIVFSDRKKKNRAPYIKLSISQEEMWDFLNHEIFYESMYTDIDTFSSQRDDEMFFFERAKAANDFGDYIRIYQLRLPNKSKKEIIEYMFDSNKISAYILEHPEQLQAVLSYRINSRETIMQYAIRKSGMTIDEINKRWKRFGKGNREGVKEYIHVQRKYLDALLGKDNEFFKAYYCFLYNKDRIKGFLDYNNLTEEEARMVEEGANKLREQLSSSKTSMMKNPIILTEVMHTMSPKKDVNVFYDTIYAIKDYNRYHGLMKPKQFTVLNVERYSALNQERELGISKQMISTEKRKKLAKKQLVGAGIILAAQGILAYLSRRGAFPTDLKPAMAIGGLMGVMVFRNALFLGAKNFLEKYLPLQTRNVKNYEAFLDEMEKQDFNNGGR